MTVRDRAVFDVDAFLGDAEPAGELRQPGDEIAGGALAMLDVAVR